MANFTDAPAILPSQLASTTLVGELEGNPASVVRVPGRTVTDLISGAATGFLSFATVALRDADTTTPIGSVGYVYYNNSSASDPANGFYQKISNTAPGHWISAPWLAGDLAEAVQPLVDQAEAAQAAAEAAQLGTEAAAAGVATQITDTLNGLLIRGGGAEVNGVIPLASIVALDAESIARIYMSFMTGMEIESEPLQRLVTRTIAGLQVITGHNPDFSFAAVQIAPNGRYYVKFGRRHDGSWFPDGGAAEPGMLYHTQSNGQSNDAADESRPVLSTAPTGWGALRFQRGLNTWSAADNPTTPELRAAGGFDLVALVQSNVETFANGFADHFKARVKGVSRFATGDQSDGDSVLVSMVSLGGRKLTELGPIDDGASGNPGVRTPGGHYRTQIDDIHRAKAAAVSAGKSYVLLGQDYDQGESESSDLKTYFTGTALAPSVVLSNYVAGGTAMVAQYDADARAATGDARSKPTFLNPPNATLIATAHRLIVNASPLAFSYGPRYQMPSALNASNGLSGGSQAWGNFIHHSPDAHRWKGEVRAKIKHRVLVLGEAWDALHVASASKTSATTVRAVLAGGKGNLAIDTKRMVKLRGWGFSIHDGTFDVPTNRQYATAIAITGAREITLTFASIPAGAMLGVGFSAQADIGSAPVISSVSAASNSAAGFAREAVTVAGDLTATLAPLMEEGAFYAVSNNGDVMAVREVSVSGGNTSFIGEIRERTGTFSAGETLAFSRTFVGTNIRDSDDAMAINAFASGPRAGQLYPLENWLELREGLSIQGA